MDVGTSTQSWCYWMFADPCLVYDVIGAWLVYLSGRDYLSVPGWETDSPTKSMSVCCSLRRSFSSILQKTRQVATYRVCQIANDLVRSSQRDNMMMTIFANRACNYGVAAVGANAVWHFARDSVKPVFKLCLPVIERNGIVTFFTYNVQCISTIKPILRVIA